MIKIVAVVANGAVGRGFCRLLEMDGDIEVASAVESVSSVDAQACREEELIVVVGPNIPFGSKPEAWEGLEVILISPNPRPDRLRGVTEAPMELTGSTLRAVIRRRAAGTHTEDATTNGRSAAATLAKERHAAPVREADAISMPLQAPPWNGRRSAANAMSTPGQLAPDVPSRWRAWLVDVVVGGLIGGVVGAITAVNLVIYAGVEGGYEAGIADVFRHNVVLGIATVTTLMLAPVAGVLVARRQRRRRRSSP